MQRRALGPVFRHVKALKEIRPIRSRPAHPGAQSAKRRDPWLGGQRLVRHIQRHHHQIHAGAEHQIRRLRIDIDVELGGGRDVAALEIPAAHQHHLAHPANDVGRSLKGRRDVGQRSQRTQGHRARRRAPQRLDDEVHAVLRLQRHLGLRHHRPVQPGLAMHMLRRDQLAPQRCRAARKDLHIRPARQFADHPCIPFGQGQRHIARHRHDPQHLQIFG